MKISCNVKEFAEMVRGCSNGSSCNQCALHGICDGSGVEQFIRADDITDTIKEDAHDGK